MSVTHARIKYLVDNVIEIVPIENIIEFQKCRPEDVHDFEKKKVYRARFSDDKNSQPVKLNVLISDLACGYDELRKLRQRRPQFAKVNDSDIPKTSSSDSSNSDSESTQNRVSKIKAKKVVLRDRGLSVVDKVASEKFPIFEDNSDQDEENETSSAYLREKNPKLKLLLAQTKNVSSNTDLTNKRNSKDQSTSRSPLVPVTTNATLNTSVSVNPPEISSPNANVLNHTNEEQLELEEVGSNNGGDNNGDDNTGGHDDNIGQLHDDLAGDDLVMNNENNSENFLQHVFVSRFVVDSVEYYKAKEGYGHRERSERYKPNNEGLLYLGEGKRVKADVWRMMQLEKPNMFLRELALKLWDAKDLANRAINVSKVTKPIPNRSPVKAIQLNLLRLLISLYSDFLDKQKTYTPEDKARFLKQSTHILSQKIRDLRSDERLKATVPNANVPKKRLRFS